MREFFAAMNVADSQSSIETPTMTILAPLIDILKLHIHKKNSLLSCSPISVVIPDNDGIASGILIEVVPTMSLQLFA